MGAVSSPWVNSKLIDLFHLPSLFLPQMHYEHTENAINISMGVYDSFYGGLLDYGPNRFLF